MELSPKYKVSNAEKLLFPNETAMKAVGILYAAFQNHKSTWL
jgi:hypothetical protein